MKLRYLNGVPEGLLDRVSKAKDKLLKERGTVRIISHYDADGICAAGILCMAFLRENIKFHVTLTRSLKDEFVGALGKQRYPITIFCDMGSGQLEAIRELSGDIIILDHHSALLDSEDPLQINPNLFGIDGGTEMCASSLSFLFAEVISEDNRDLSALALAGCIGDKQHINGFTGFNANMLKMAKKRGVVKEKNMLKLSGDNLEKALIEGLDPFISGLSGREDKVLEFLKRINLDPDLKIEDLDEDQKRLLASAVIVKLLSQKIRIERAEGFITKKFWLPQWNLFASDLSNYVNSAGRMDNMGTGLALCLGDESALEKAIELRKAYKDELRSGLLRLEAEGPHVMKNIQFFYCENPSLAGANAGLGMMYLFDQEKPVLALSVLDKETKISSRGTKYLISKGLDLAIACREAAQKVGGRGGGHPVASGATIPKGKEESFLELMDDIVGNQFSGEGEEIGNSA
ncbi:MAG: DHH family phosphoesterase [Thermoplasmata archaeon]|nr:MAG: DHH family phosphoesterase [Thermoplasmata archaeon]